MMERIKPDYYDRFTCIADKCTFTCCQEWKIAVDNETNRKWKKKYPPQEVKVQRKNLSAYTTKKDGGRVIRLDEEHKCPFLPTGIGLWGFGSVGNLYRFPKRSAQI